MLPKKPRRQDPTTLIWEYLEGDISPKRAEQLSEILEQKADAREQLVESAVLHSMLFEHFKQDEIAGNVPDKPGRTSAA